MNELLTQIGVGGVIVILVLRDLLPLVISGTARPGYGNNNVPKLVTRMEFDEHRKAVQYRDNCAEIVKRMEQGLAGLAEHMRQRKDMVDNNFMRMDRQFEEVKALINSYMDGGK